MKVIGITGAVGSGKSTVAKILSEKYHMKLIMADELGAMAYEPDSGIYEELRKLLGEDYIGKDGRFDRGRIAKWAYASKDNLNHLNQLIHPFVKRLVLKRIKEAEGSFRYVLLESAILIENDYDEICDEFWYVYVNEENRKKRLMESRGYSKERIEEILANQKTDEFFRKHCQIIIDNNGSVYDGIKAVEGNL